MTNPLLTGIINLKDLPKNKILVGLKKSFKEDIFNHINIIKTAKSLNLKPSKLYNFKANEKVTINFLLKLYDYLVKQGFKQFSYEHIEKNIEIMGTKRGNLYIKNPKLPFNFNNNEGAYFISAIFFDGGIDRQFKPHYGNIDLGMRLRIVKCTEKIFGTIHSKETNAQKRLFIRFPKTMGVILNHCFKIGIGNKMYCNNKIPNFIFKLNKKAKSCFIKQAFDDDGSVSANKYLVGITGTTDVKKKNFNKKNLDFGLFNDLKKLLYHFDIDPNPLRLSKSFSNQEYGKKGEFYRHIFTFSITGRKNLESFYNQIGFNLDYKMKRLNSILKNYKQNQLRKGEIHKIALEVCKKKKDNITIPNLAKEIKRSYRQTVRVMKELEKKKFVKLKKPSINVKGRRLPAFYELI